ncbi:hypothetical protein [Saccharospirillum salsuginis]|uniref:Uncharacterized protein n=1 Tax=Saccharospirillum salsuginis TaxID=418750 RepID=A0A918KQA3_9GAMM|nr:hypothetical protein [Saccharospirillum salsuginis]GGX69156.1 hypothetical protein GCM10007392_41090 [Saccharospirillum salsuginis]
MKNIQPYQGENEGLVIIPTDVTAAPGHEIWYDYVFTVNNLDTDEQHRLRISPRVGDEYEFLGQLPEGRYIIERRVSIAKNGRRVYPRSMVKRFEVEAGKVSIPFKLEISSHDNAQYFNMTFYSRHDQRRLFEEQLAPRSDFQGWALK